MKIESRIETASIDGGFQVYADGGESAALFAGNRKVLSIGRIKTGKFDEALGLVEKLRRHLANDRLSAAMDSENVIPFGCEYRVKRHWQYSANIVELTDDISADNGGRIDDLALENIEFCGKAEKISILFAGASAMQEFPLSGVIYDGEKLPVLLRVSFADGLSAEVYCGDDFWRHQCAGSVPGAAARHTIEADENSVRWVRHILSVPEETVVEKRPWRFKTIFAVSRQSAESSAGAAIQFDGCFAAPAKHRDFRTFIRKQTPGSCAALRVKGNVFCTDGSHVSRPGKAILHGMFGELFDEYIWGSSAMARKGGSCVIFAAAAEAQESLILRNMAAFPAELSFPDLEDAEE